MKEMIGKEMAKREAGSEEAANSTVTVNEVKCQELGCADVETNIALKRSAARGGRLVFKINKRAADVEEAEALRALDAALALGGGRREAQVSESGKRLWV